MARSTAREVAMQLVYAWMMGGDDGPGTKQMIGAATLDAEDDGYIADVTAGVRAHQEQIDELIERFAAGWSLGRIARVDLAILRLALLEMLYREDIPVAASINEAVELSKKFSTAEAANFINGVLGSINRQESQRA